MRSRTDPKRPQPPKSDEALVSFDAAIVASSRMRPAMSIDPSGELRAASSSRPTLLRSDASGCTPWARSFAEGTTGMPEAVMLSHADVTSNVATTIDIFPFRRAIEGARGPRRCRRCAASAGSTTATRERPDSAAS